MRAIILALTLALAGCTGNLLGPSGSPASLYRLSAPTDVPTTARAARWQLVIEEPTATQELNTARIAVVPEPLRIDYFAGVAWGDRVPAMLRELMLQTFERSGKLPAVQRQSGNVRSDFLLSADLRDFEVDAGQANVRVALTARLIRTRDQTIVASRDFEATAPVGGNFESTIAAFDQATQSLLRQLADWTLTQGNSNP